MKTYYVSGAIYDTKIGFRLVRPTDGLPYVSTDNEHVSSLQNLTSHHSGYYELSENLSTAKLVRITWEMPESMCPKTVKLSSTQISEIKKCILTL